MDIQELSETDLVNVLKQELCMLTNKVLIRLTKLNKLGIDIQNVTY